MTDMSAEHGGAGRGPASTPADQAGRWPGRRADGRPVRIVIADDERHFRLGLRHALEASDLNFEVVGEATNGLEAIEQGRLLHPDVVLLDLHMPGTDGLAAARALSAFDSHVRILMLTVSDSPDDLAQAGKAGASGYMLKERSLHEVAEAVLALSEGGAWPQAAGC
jgi:DNA-binding NarL/FixJ family response regulator